MTLPEYILLAASSLFVIVDPLGTVPAFLAMTPGDTAEARIKMARIACFVAAGVLMVFAVAGKWIFKLFGITLPAFQFAASLVLLLVALDMLKAQRSRVRETSEETAAGVEKTDIAVAPLAIPMLAGAWRDFHRHSFAYPSQDAGPASCPLPVHPGCFVRQLPHSPPLGAWCTVAEPYRHAHYRPDHGAFISGCRRSVSYRRCETAQTALRFLSLGIRDVSYSRGIKAALPGHRTAAKVSLFREGNPTVLA